MHVTRGARRAVASLAAVALAASLAACSSSKSSGSAQPTTGSSSVTAQPPVPPTSVVTFEQATAGSGKGLTVGFIQLLLSVPFPQAVQKGVEEQAKIAGVNLVTCDSKGTAATALACAQQFKTQGVNGVIQFQADANAAPSICAADGKVPVIAVDIAQKPCQISFMGAANNYAGQLLGYNIGKYFSSKFDCKYDAFLSLESQAVGQVNEDRMGGIRTGFASVCGKIHDLRKLDTGPGGQAADAQRLTTDTLTALPARKHIIVVGINEDVVQAAAAAARSSNRTGDLYYAPQGFDPTNYCQLYSNPNWVGSIAYFPEKYGQILIPNMIKAMKGEKIPDQLLVPHIFINKDNAKQYYPNFSC